jgi:electron transport complex protein RnfA
VIRLEEMRESTHPVEMRMFAGMRERLALAQVPPAFAGTPIAFIAAGLLSLAFMGFAGLPTH